MGVPVSQMWTVATYVIGKRLRGQKRYPLVVMLEPLFRCNLACAGCGKIQYPAHILKQNLSPEQCFAAVEEAGAPMVAIPGGEPLLHPQIAEIVAGLVHRKKYIYLCTNALLLKEKLAEFKPSKYLSFSVHMDGPKKEHDFAVCRLGTYDAAVDAIKAAVKKGFRVTTNTTVFEGADPHRIREFFDAMMKLGVEGMMVSPGYSYDKAPDQQHFLSKPKTQELFRTMFSKPKRHWRFNQSPLFIRLLMGKEDFDCTPWGNPTYNMFGWQKPCYLMQEGYAAKFKELIDDTAWENYGRKSGNKKCANCMVHSGFEPSAVNLTFGSIRGFVQTAKATVTVRFDMTDAVDSPQGRRIECTSDAVRKEAVELAFDYRGDVSVELDDGSNLVGYLANRDASAPIPWIEIFPATGAEKQRLAVSRIRSIAFTGIDTAAGKTWEAWLKKVAEAEANGQIAELYPQDLDKPQ